MWWIYDIILVLDFLYSIYCIRTLHMRKKYLLSPCPLLTVPSHLYNLYPTVPYLYLLGRVRPPHVRLTHAE